MASIRTPSFRGGPCRRMIAVNLFQLLVGGLVFLTLFIIAVRWAAKFTIVPTQARMLRELALANAGNVALTFTDEGSNRIPPVI